MILDILNISVKRSTAYLSYLEINQTLKKSLLIHVNTILYFIGSMV